MKVQECKNMNRNGISKIITKKKVNEEFKVRSLYSLKLVQKCNIQ